MDNILNIKVEDLARHKIPFMITVHFLEQMKNRSLLKHKGIDDEIKNIIERSIIVDSRSRTVMNLINSHCRESLYLYYSKSNIVFVLEQNKLSFEYNVLKTAYNSNDSLWLAKWLPATKKSNRIKFSDSYKNYEIILNYRYDSNKLKYELEEKLDSFKSNIIHDENLKKEAIEILANNSIVNKIVSQLKEENPKAVKQISIILEEMGEEKVMEILNETLKIEAQGGIMVNNGTHRRTPGGVFFHKIPKEIYSKIKNKIQ